MRERIELLGKSAKTLRHNLFLVVPNFMNLGITIFFSLLFLWINGLLPILLENPAFIFEQNRNIIDVFNSIEMSNGFFKLISTFIGFVLANFLIGSGLLAMRYGMMTDLVKGKKTSLMEGFKHGGRGYLRVVEMKFVVYVFMAILILVSNLILLRFTGFSENILLFVSLIIFLSYLFVNMVLFLRYPIMFIENRRAIPSLRKAFKCFRKKTKFVFIVWLVIFIITVIFNVLLLPLSSFIGILFEAVYGFIFATVIFYIVRSVLKFFVQVWTDLFLFYTYFKQK